MILSKNYDPPLQALVLQLHSLSSNNTEVNFLPWLFDDQYLHQYLIKKIQTNILFRAYQQDHSFKLLKGNLSNNCDPQRAFTNWTYFLSINFTLDALYFYESFCITSAVLTVLSSDLFWVDTHKITNNNGM